MRLLFTTLPRVAAMGAALALIGACSRDATTSSKSPSGISPAEAQLIGHDAAGEAQSVSASFTVSDLFGFGFDGEGGFPAPALSPTSGCPTITPFPPVDSDSDRVPDDVTLSFTLPACQFGHDGDTLAVSGTIHITDPTPSARDVALRVEFGDLLKKFSSPEGFFQRRLNGAIQFLRTDTSFTGIDSTTVDIESSRDSARTLAKAWVVTFVADSGGAEAVHEDEHLPSGTFTINGSTTQTRGSTTRSFTVTTITPLHFDASCTAEQRFTSGELQIVIVGGEHAGTINVVFNGCGKDPTITMTA